MSRYIVHVGTGTIIDLDDTCYYLDSEDITGDVETEDDLLDAITVHGIDMRDVVLVWESRNPLDN
jgi:hypothetical protein